MLSAAIVGHLVGDYLLQNHWMALGKKRSTPICLLHCALWTAAVVLIGGFGLGATFVLFATHFVQDRTNIVTWWMDAIGQRDFRIGLAPWSSIVVDNVWHIVTIWAVWRFEVYAQ